MYIISNIIKDVKSYAIVNSVLYISGVNNVINFNSNKELLRTEDHLQSLQVTNGNVFIITNGGLGYLILKDSCINMNMTILYLSEENSISYLREGEDEKNTLFGVLNQPTIQNKIKDSSTIFFVHEGKYFRRNFKNNSIEVFSFPYGNPLWTFPLEPLGTFVNLSNETLPYEVKYFIGIWNNLLLVQLKNATVLFLDIETGVQKHIIHFKEHVSLPETVGLNDAPMMQLAGDELYWLSNQSLFKVTLQNFIVYNIRNYFNEPRELQYRFFYNTILDGKIYFTSEKGWRTVIPHHLGVMDAETGEVLWEYKPEKSHGLSEAPQFADGKLYMRTNNKELFIFEEEK